MKFFAIYRYQDRLEVACREGLALRRLPLAQLPLSVVPDKERLLQAFGSTDSSEREWLHSQSLPSEGSGELYPFLEANFDSPPSDRTLPAPFVLDLLPAFRRQLWSTVERALELYHQLALAQQPNLRRALGCLPNLDWWEKLLQLPESVRQPVWLGLLEVPPETFEWDWEQASKLLGKTACSFQTKLAYWLAAAFEAGLSWELMEAFGAKVTTSPFLIKGRSGRAAVQILETWPDLLDAPDPCWMHLEKIARREQHDRRLADAFRALRAQQPELLREGFLEFPHQMVRMAAALGVVDQPQRLLRSLRSEVLFQVDISTGAVLEKARRLLEVGPIPQRLLDYLIAEKRPSPKIEQELRETLDRHHRLARIERILHQTRGGFKS